MMFLSGGEFAFIISLFLVILCNLLLYLLHLRWYISLYTSIIFHSRAANSSFIFVLIFSTMFCPHCSALLPSSDSDAIVCASCDYSCTYFDIPRRHLQLQSSSEKTQDPEWLTLYKQQKKKKAADAQQQQQQKGSNDSKKSDKDESVKKSKSKEAEKKSETKKREKEKEIESNQSKKRQRTSSESSSKSIQSIASPASSAQSSSSSESSSSSSSESSSDDEHDKIESAARKKHARAEVEETCPSCGHQRATFYTVQLRSVDEGQTVFCKFIIICITIHFFQNHARYH